jgi:hypothetical protein
MMTVTCKIDRVAALKVGIETASDTIKIEADLATLSPEDRELLAGRLNRNLEVCSRERDGLFYDGCNYYAHPSTHTHDGRSLVRMVVVEAPTVAAILSAIRDEDADAAQYAAKQAREKVDAAAKRRESTLEVLRSRKTQMHYRNVVASRSADGTVQYDDGGGSQWWAGSGSDPWHATYRVAAWPHSHEADEEIMQSPEAKAWEAELDVAQELAINMAKTHALARLEQKEVAERLATEDEQHKTAERLAWIAEHGSPRLQRLAAEEIECENVYLEERLALERPGWAYDSDVRGEAKDTRNSKQEGLDLLDEARKIAPDAKLVWWVIEHVHNDTCDECGCDKETDWKGYACTTEFLGEDIVFGTPSEYAR